jgi:hypothetical protein
MTEQEFRDSCAKFDIRVLLGGFQDMGDYLLCQWHDITLGHYNKNSCLAVITNNFVKNKFYIMGKRYNLVNADLENTTNFLHNDKMEERFAYLIKAYKQGIINERLKNLENDFEQV